MVEFFGQQMDGMLFSQNGWVQSFGRRCVRPPTFWSDISRPKAMTVREYKVAQALTKKPVKGMVRKASRELMMIRNLCALNMTSFNIPSLTTSIPTPPEKISSLKFAAHGSRYNPQLVLPSCRHPS